MYYLIYGSLYLVSLLPFWILYGISDSIAYSMYFVFSYRKTIILDNIRYAFPEKTDPEHRKIAIQFYRNFVDTFIETLKLLSMSDRSFDRYNRGDFSVVNDIVAKGKNLQIMGGHFFNWEYANLVMSRNIRGVPRLGVYKKIDNKIFEKIAYDFRSRYGTTLIPTFQFKERMKELMKGQYTMLLLADQNTWPEKGLWANFMHRMVPFIPGPHEASVRNNTAVIFVDFVKEKRGYYRYDFQLITEGAAEMTPESLLLRYRDWVEASIRRQPTCYLWSHRRWKSEYNDSYRKLDESASMPTI